MTRKVIYICLGRLTDKMARDWYIDFLISKGVPVEYWDIVALVREEHTEGGALNPNYLRVLRTFGDLRRALRQPDNRDALYVVLVSYNGRLAPIFRLLSRERCRMINFAWGVLPRDGGLNWPRVVAWVSSPGRYVREIIYRSRASALRRLGLVAPFAITFAAGGAAMGSSGGLAERVVPINYFDYDLYVQARSQSAPRLNTGRYIVFLDSNLPFHSDLAFSGVPRIDPQPYYRSLNSFFDRLEQACGCSVVIAAHPRAQYTDATFAGRAMHRLVTAELVRDAELVVSHTSTAMSFAVLNTKPLLFIYTGDMARLYKGSLMRDLRCFARYLDAPIRDIDAPGDARAVDVPPINAARYERYKYDFLTSPQSENTPTQEIFWRELRMQ